MIRRSSLNYIEKLLSKNSNWNVLEIGCGYSANKRSNVICDILDLSKFYPDKKFIKLEDKNLPFSDKEFDFVIASHVLEHVTDLDFFIKEIERVSSKGYIELPTKLEDNLVFENKNEHIWHMDFDDDDQILLISKKKQYFEPIITVSTAKKINEIFRKSLVIELYWEEKIDYLINKSTDLKVNKISILNLLKKFISKKLRSIFK